jgi:hypothetical protein
LILRVACSFKNEHHLLPDAAVTDRFYNLEWNVFTGRYEENAQFGDIFKLPVSQ